MIPDSEFTRGRDIGVPKWREHPLKTRTPVFQRFRWLPGRFLTVFSWSFLFASSGVFSVWDSFGFALRIIYIHAVGIFHQLSNIALHDGKILSIAPRKPVDFMINGCQETGLN